MGMLNNHLLSSSDPLRSIVSPDPERILPPTPWILRCPPAGSRSVFTLSSCNRCLETGVAMNQPIKLSLKSCFFKSVRWGPPRGLVATRQEWPAAAFWTPGMWLGDTGGVTVAALGACSVSCSNAAKEQGPPPRCALRSWLLSSLIHFASGRVRGRAASRGSATGLLLGPPRGDHAAPKPQVSAAG